MAGGGTTLNKTKPRKLSCVCACVSKCVLNIKHSNKGKHHVDQCQSFHQKHKTLSVLLCSMYCFIRRLFSVLVYIVYGLRNHWDERAIPAISVRLRQLPYSGEKPFFLIPIILIRCWLVFSFFSLCLSGTNAREKMLNGFVCIKYLHNNQSVK